MYYFSSSSLTPSKCKGTLKFKKAPPCFGNAKDAEGTMWNFQGFVGGCYLVALTETIDPYWGSTATNAGYGHHRQTWHSYKVEVINPDKHTVKIGNGFWLDRSSINKN